MTSRFRQRNMPLKEEPAGKIQHQEPAKIPEYVRRGNKFQAAASGKALIIYESD